MGMGRGLMRGARSSIVVLREDDLGALSQLLLELTPEQKSSLMVVLVGSVLSREQIGCSIEQILRQTCELRRARSVQETLKTLADLAVAHSNRMPESVLVMLLDERHCPEFQFQPNQGALPANTKEEIRQIRQFAVSQGASVSDAACVIGLEGGVAELELATGALAFRSRLCEECKKECKKESKICIVGQDKGWSSEGMGPRALLTMAKLQALCLGRLPYDVQLQIERAAHCPGFTPKLGAGASRRSSYAQPSDQLAKERRTTLLEEAEKRVSQGRLPYSVYSMLKSKLQRAENRFNRAEGADDKCH